MKQMNKPMAFSPCAYCFSHCKPVFAILLIVLGVVLLRGEILYTTDQTIAPA